MRETAAPTDLELEYDHPDEAQSYFGVAVGDVLRVDVHQSNVLVAKEVERYLDVLEPVELEVASLSRLKQ